MASIEEARAQVQTARNLLAEKRAQAQQVESQLNEQERSLPSTTSQEALRQRFKGISGRLQRQRIDEQRNAIREQQGYVSSYQGDLGNYEKDINATEQQINDYEAAVKKAEEQYAYDREQAATELKQYQQDFEAANPGEKLIIDWSKLRITGVESGSLAMSMPVDSYNARIDELNKQLGDTLSGNKIADINTGLSRNDKISYVPNKNIPSGLLPSVSAMSINQSENVSNLPKAPEWKPNIYRPLQSLSYFAEKGIEKISPKTANLTRKGDTVLRNIPLVNVSANTVLPYAEAATSSALFFPGFAGTTGVTRGAVSSRNVLTGAIENIKPVQTMSFREIREANALGKAPTEFKGARVETSKGGFDVLVGIKSSKPTGFMDRVLMVRPQTKITQVVQPFATTSRGAVMEGGKGFSLTVRPNSILRGGTFESSLFETSGQATRTGGATAVSKRGGTYLRNPLDVETSVGRVRVQETGRQSGSYWEARSPLFSDSKLVIKGKGFAVKGTPENIFFGGFSKQSPSNEKVINILSGKIEKVRFYGDGFYNPKGIVRPNTKGSIRRIKLSTPEDSFSDFIFGSGKKSSQGYFKSLYSGSTGAELALGGTRGVRAVNLKSSSASILGIAPKQSQVPKSDYWGTGQYERTESIAPPKPRENSIDLLGDFTNVAQKSGQRVNLKQPPKLKEKSVNVFDDMLGFVQTPSERIKQTSSYKMNQKYTQKTQQKQTQSFNWFTGERITPRATAHFHPSVSYKTTNGKIIKTAPGQYLVMVKRYGSFSIVGEASTLEEAKRILSYNLRSTLGASGFISSGGRKQDVSNLWGNMFRPAKKDAFTLVQRRGKRLSSRSEVNEIMGFKRVKGRGRAPRKINWGWTPKKKKGKKSIWGDWW